MTVINNIIRTVVRDNVVTQVDGSAVIPTVKFTAEGDSITAWNGTDGYPNVAVPSVTGNWSKSVNNIATWGITTTNMLNDYNTRIGASFDASKTRNVLSITGGTNDGVESNELSIYRNIRRMIYKARYETGYQRAVLCTIVSRNEPAFTPPGNGTYDGSTLALNVHYRNYYNNDLDCDALADFGADSHFNLATDCTNPSFYADNTHPNTGGQAVMGGIAVTAYDDALNDVPSRISAPATWSLFDYTTQYGQLTNSNRTAGWNGTGFFHNNFRGFEGKASGKWYYELLINDSSYTGVGVCNFTFFQNGGSGEASHPSGSVNACGGGYGTTNGNFYINSVLQTTQPYWANGDVLEFALDMDNQRLWYRIAGGNWNGNASYNPATNVGGIDISSLVNGNGKIYPMCQIFADFGADLGQVTTRFTAAQITGIPPSGFTALV